MARDFETKYCIIQDDQELDYIEIYERVLELLNTKAQENGWKYKLLPTLLRAVPYDDCISYVFIISGSKK